MTAISPANGACNQVGVFFESTGLGPAQLIRHLDDERTLAKDGTNELDAKGGVKRVARPEPGRRDLIGHCSQSLTRRTKRHSLAHPSRRRQTKGDTTSSHSDVERLPEILHRRRQEELTHLRRSARSCRVGRVGEDGRELLDDGEAEARRRNGFRGQAGGSFEGERPEREEEECVSSRE